MSLDVYLRLPGGTHQHDARIFIREGGQTREISRAEWDERYPGREPFTLLPGATDEVYSANITHNLNQMAEAAGIYYALWRPEVIGITRAEHLIDLLRMGLAFLNRDPDRFQPLNPANGWGTYEGLVSFVAEYLAACEAYPDAEVSASR